MGFKPGDFPYIIDIYRKSDNPVDQMKYRPTKGFLFCMLVLAGAGGAAGWAWQRANRQFQPSMRPVGFLNAVKCEVNPFIYTDWERRKTLLPRTDAALASLEREFPALKVEKRQVPVEENGFVQMHYLVAGNSLMWFPRSSQLMDVVMGRATADAEIRSALAGEKDTVARLEKVAAMKRWSSLDLPAGDFWFVPCGSYINAGKILLVRARVAAGEGNEEEALRLAGLVRNLADRFHDLDAPNLQTETVSLSLERTLQETIMKDLLPTIGRNADLAQWRALVGQDRYSPRELADVMRGEFQIVARNLLLPMVVDEQNDYRPRDGMTVARVYATSFDELVRSILSSDLKELQSVPGMRQPREYPNLSAEGRQILETLFVGAPSWIQGYIRTAYRADLNNAVLDMVVSEQRGVKAETPEKEAPGGGVFVFDPQRRTLALPASLAKLEIAPVALPW